MNFLTNELSEKTVLTDLLSHQKFITGVYNSDLLESATPEVKKCFLGLLEDEHRIQEDVFRAMYDRNMYPLEQAEEKKLTEAKMKFSQNATV